MNVKSVGWGLGNQIQIVLRGGVAPEALLEVFRQPKREHPFAKAVDCFNILARVVNRAAVCQFTGGKRCGNALITDGQRHQPTTATFDCEDALFFVIFASGW